MTNPPLPTIQNRSDEPTTLTEFLDYYRASLLDQCVGLTIDQLNQPLRDHSSDLTLGGLLIHMALVEDTWFAHRFAAQPAVEPWASAPFDEDRDWDFHNVTDWTPESIVAQFQESCDRSRAITSTALKTSDGLDSLSTLEHPEDGHWNLRWIMVHMIEEYARHCGHADLIRESVDGKRAE